MKFAQGPDCSRSAGAQVCWGNASLGLISLFAESEDDISTQLLTIGIEPVATIITAEQTGRGAKKEDR